MEGPVPSRTSENYQAVGRTSHRWTRWHRGRSSNVRASGACRRIAHATSDVRGRMSGRSETMRVIIPLTFRKRNGRPQILPPADSPANDDPGPDPHIMKAIAQAWSWRRRLESGACSTNRDLAAEDRISNQFISRYIRLAYLAPTVLERL